MTPALADIFGVAILAENESLPSWRHSPRFLHRGVEEEYDRIVMTSLGNNVMDENSRERRGLRTRHPRVMGSSISPPPSRGDDRSHSHFEGATVPEDADMDMDDTEGDCIPSRSSSPPPSIHLPIQPSPSPTRSIASVRHTSSRPSPRATTRDDRSTTKDYDSDIAGTCFDPHGGFIYVATTDSLSEWAVRGADKRWWGDSKWA